ncbi:MAG: ScyD/ScyE family protein [Propionicimonas sp.]
MPAARILIATTALGAAVTLTLAIPAGAHTPAPAPAPTSTVLTTAVGAPFNLDVRQGRILVADGGPGIIGKVKADGTVKTLVSGAEGTSGVALSRNGKYLAYTHTVGGPPAGITDSGVTIDGPRSFTAKADTLAYERAHNPDGAIRYGVDNPSQCVTDALTKVGFPVSYTGAIDSHAYSLAAWGKGFILADAGANALLRISPSGKISTLAVFPAQPSKITAEAASSLGLASCVVGVTYKFEAVPTDVEVGKDGYLYVTTLPGGPEDPSLGARGKVYKVNPWSGKVWAVAAGLLGPTNLAISGGKLYVAEAFAGRISMIKHGVVSEFLPLPGALAIEAGHDGTLYAATGIFGPPSIVKINTHKGWRH